MNQRPVSSLADHPGDQNVKTDVLRAVLAMILLVSWKLPIVLSSEEGGLFARAVKLSPLLFVLGGLFMSRRTLWVWPSRSALILLGLAAVIIEVALIRSITSSILTAREVIQMTAEWATFVAIGATLFWDDADRDRQQAGRLLVTVIGGYVGANVLLDQIGLVNPSPLREVGDAQLLSLIGLHQARTLYPIADGVNNFGIISGAALLAGILLCFSPKASIPWRIIGFGTFVAGVLAIVGTDSRGAFLAAVVVAIAIGLAPRRAMWIVTAAAVVAALSIPLAITGVGAGVDVGDRFQVFSRKNEDIATLNNRNKIWEAGLAVVLSGEAGLFGYGAFGHVVSGASVAYRDVFGSVDEASMTFHNTAIQYFVDTGYAGVLVIAALAMVALRRQIRLIAEFNSASRIPMALLLYLLVAGASEAVGTIYHRESMALVILVVMASVSPLPSVRRKLAGETPPDRDKELLRWRLKHSQRLSRFRGAHQNEDCFIIGNGPSLNKMDLSILNGYHTFGLNKIYLLFDRVDLRLSYHVAVNSLVIEQSAKDFEQLKCPSFLSYGSAKQIVRELGHIYFLATDSCFSAPYSFYSDVAQPISEGFTVTYVALQMAFYMGFKNVFLVGVDHAFAATGKPNDEQLLTGEDPNHFDPRYFGGQKWHLPDLEASEMSYRLAKFFYNRDGRQIYDATVDGKLQIFPRLSLEQALSMCKKRGEKGM